MDKKLFLLILISALILSSLALYSLKIIMNKEDVTANRQNLSSEAKIPESDYCDHYSTQGSPVNLSTLDQWLIESSERDLAASFGDNYTESYLRLVWATKDSFNDKEITYLVYRVEHPAQPELNRQPECTFNKFILGYDSDRNLLPSSVELPNCIDDPENCPPLPVTEEEAVRIIRDLVPSNYNLTVKPYLIYRSHYGGSNFVGYTWESRYELYQASPYSSGDGSTKLVRISAKTGELVN